MAASPYVSVGGSGGAGPPPVVLSWLFVVVPSRSRRSLSGVVGVVVVALKVVPRVRLFCV